MKKNDYRKDVICVRLADGYKVMVSKEAKARKLTFSEAIRQAVQAWLGI